MCILRGHEGTDTGWDKDVPEARLPLLMVLLRSREVTFPSGLFPDLALGSDCGSWGTRGL